ncbi:hypothetical protein [Natronospora cellulosivora (SeqCode)]
MKNIIIVLLFVIVILSSNIQAKNIPDDILDNIHLNFENAIVNRLRLEMFYLNLNALTFAPLNPEDLIKNYQSKVVINEIILIENMEIVDILSDIEIRKRKETDIINARIFAKLTNNDGTLITFSFNDLKGEILINEEYIVKDKRINDYLLQFLPYNIIKDYYNN